MSQTFESAYKRLQEIHKQLSTQDITNIDELLALQNEAKELYEYLQDRLQAVTQHGTDTTNTE